MRPAASFTVDGRALASPEIALVALRVELGLGRRHDGLTAILSHYSPVADIAEGAQLALALGYGDSTHDVLTGEVAAVERLPGGVRVEVLAATAQLSSIRVGQAYVEQSVADIVTDLVGKTQVQTGEIDASLKLFAYHVDERRTVWAHLIELSRIASCDVSTSADGKLDFRPPRAGPTADHTLRHGADLLGWSVGPRATVDPPAIVPYGAASEEGSAKWHLLLREPDGGSPSEYTRVAETLRDRDGAQALAEGLRRSARRRATGGQLSLVGNAAIRPGDVLELSEMPHGEDGVVRARSITHVVDGAGGFRTRVAIEGVAS